MTEQFPHLRTTRFQGLQRSNFCYNTDVIGLPWEFLCQDLMTINILATNKSMFATDPIVGQGFTHSLPTNHVSHSFFKLV